MIPDWIIEKLMPKEDDDQKEDKDQEKTDQEAEAAHQKALEKAKAAEKEHGTGDYSMVLSVDKAQHLPGIPQAVEPCCF